MGRKGARHTLKRLNAPMTYPIPRKAVGRYIMYPSGSGHKRDESIPLGVILRNLLKIAKNDREINYIINNGYCELDGTVIRDYKRNIGSMDVLKITKTNTAYRMLPTQSRRRITLVPTDPGVDWKLCKITGKTSVKGGGIQFHLHDGRNIVFPKEVPKNKKDKFNDPKWVEARPGGTFKITLPSQKIIDYYPLEENASVLIDKGINRAQMGKYAGVDKHIGTRRSIAVIISGEEQIRTALENIFVVGREQPEITVSEEVNK